MRLKKPHLLLVLAIVCLVGKAAANNTVVVTIDGSSIVSPNTAVCYIAQASPSRTDYVYAWCGAVQMTTTPSRATATVGAEPTVFLVSCIVSNTAGFYGEGKKTVTVVRVDAVSIDKYAIEKDSNLTISVTASTTPTTLGNCPLEWALSTNNGGAWLALNDTGGNIALDTSRPVGKYLFRSRAKGSTSTNDWRVSPICYLVDIQLDVPLIAREGEQCEKPFNVSVEPSGIPISAYAWQATWPSGAGNMNNVSVQFSTNLVSGVGLWLGYPRYFAYPDSQWYSETVTSNSFCYYGINCQVTISNTTICDGIGAQLMVAVYGELSSGTNQLGDPVTTTNTLGETGTPFLDGSPRIGMRNATNGVIEYYVTGHDFIRVLPVHTNYLPQNSQFRAKTDAHETVHVEQYETGMFTNTWDLNECWIAIQDLNSTNLTELCDAILTSIGNCVPRWQTYVIDRIYDRELEAYRKERDTAPFYMHTKDSEVAEMFHNN